MYTYSISDAVRNALDYDDDYLLDDYSSDSMDCMDYIPLPSSQYVREEAREWA